ncbi:IS1595 family transposase [Burkholderia vietnamiensis]|uniref:IS1595 family transposase n=1 Tax=Burkholderia vietnamiensis TaxID=60552 RepID=UPI001B9315E9|nr:IS1595 family transposase [Burkholderia vietnamiensis]MBR8189241.1 IS1595 family transposase [Burkholderia vietnamiensis]
MSEFSPAPRAGVDYPQTWSQFEDWFATETDCVRYLEQLRWPDGFVCPKCSVAQMPYRSSRGRLICRACHHPATVTAGTIFDKTRTPIKVWLAAAWHITSQKSGMSALGLQRVLGFGSYQTAWTILHRFRRAMVRPGRERLKGVVEVDQSYLAIQERRAPLAGSSVKRRTTKVIVIIAVEILEPKGFGRIRLRQIEAESIASVEPFVREVVEPGSVLRTDGAAIYRALHEDYVHEPTALNSQMPEGIPAHIPLPGVHRVASLLKRWLLGTHQGAVKPAQLEHYLDEFVFRFNRRASRSRGLLFYRLLQQAVQTESVTYRQIAKHHRQTP